MELETRRLVLREMAPADLDGLLSVLGDPENMRYYPAPFDREQVRAWIRRNQERYRIFGFGLWAVVLKDTGRLIGDCGITMQQIRGSIRPEIGYHIHRAFQRRGYAREAAQACRDWGFSHTPFGVLYACMKWDNAASAATAASAGMRPAGEYAGPDGVKNRFYAVTRREWETLRQAGQNG